MAQDVGSTTTGDLSNVMTDFSVGAMQTDAASDQKETEWMNERWSSWFGYYKTIPELNTVIDAKAAWSIGKGFEATPSIKKTLKAIENIEGATGGGHEDAVGVQMNVNDFGKFKENFEKSIE